jgi:NADH-quinone oxidoreductase subunit J
VLLEMALGRRVERESAAPRPAAAHRSNTRALGQLLYVDYVYPFEIAAVVLLVAIIAAIALTHRKRKATRYQDPALQAKVRREDRVRIVQMPAEKG